MAASSLPFPFFFDRTNKNQRCTHFHVLFIFTPSVSGEGKGRREGSREREGEIPEVGGAEEVVSIFRYAT